MSLLGRLIGVARTRCVRTLDFLRFFTIEQRLLLMRTGGLARRDVKYRREPDLSRIHNMHRLMVFLALLLFLLPSLPKNAHGYSIISLDSLGLARGAVRLGVDDVAPQPVRGPSVQPAARGLENCRNGKIVIRASGSACPACWTQYVLWSFFFSIFLSMRFSLA